MGRAKASTPPPAGNGLMMRTGFAGQACAWTTSEASVSRPAMAPPRTSVDIMRLSSVFLFAIALCGAAHSLVLSRFLGKILHRRLHAALLVRHARDGEPHLHAGQRAGESEVVEVAQVADAEDLALQLGQPHPERHVEMREDLVAQLVGIMAR